MAHCPGCRCRSDEMDFRFRDPIVLPIEAYRCLQSVISDASEECICWDIKTYESRVCRAAEHKPDPTRLSDD